MQRPDDKARIWAASDEITQRSQRQVAHRRRLHALVTDRRRALGYLHDFVIGGLVGEFSPAVVARDLAMAATWGTDLDPEDLEAVTVEVASAAGRLVDDDWWPEVLWGWPGLPRVALDLALVDPTTGAWELVTKAVPALGSPSGRSGFVGDLLASGAGGRRWATLSTVSAYFAPRQRPRTGAVPRPP